MLIQSTLDTVSDILGEHSNTERFLFINQDLITLAQEIPNPISALEIDLNVGFGFKKLK